MSAMRPTARRVVMNIRTKLLQSCAAAVIALIALLVPDPAAADTDRVREVDNVCGAINGTTPGTTVGCAMCHASTRSTRRAPEWDWAQAGRTANNNTGSGQQRFCFVQGIIQLPSAATTSVGQNQPVNFSARGFSPFGGTLTYTWTLSDGRTFTGAAPGAVAMPTPGTVNVRLNVRDTGGRATDGTPAETWNTRTVNVTGANQPPNGTITPPSNIIQNQPVTFQGAGTDPDNNLPLAFAWNFGANATPSTSTEQNPSVTFSTTGPRTVTLTVRDGLNLADPTPATVSVTVNAPTSTNQAPNGTITPPATLTQGVPATFQGSATDENPATVTYAWNFGANATPATSSAQNPTVTFSTTGQRTVSLTVTDSQGVPDATPATVSVTVNAPAPVLQGCRDNDRDGYSPDGGACGPRDCNDSNAAVNPGAREVCGDGLDNDCDGQADASDRECNGTDCVGSFLARPVVITQASWGPDDGVNQLKVEGNQAQPGAAVTLFNAATGALLGTTTVDSTGDDIGQWEFEQTTNAPPCRVRVSINGATAERAVSNAPNCGAPPPPPPANRPPVATITAPAGNVTITQGQSVDFAGTGSDPDGNPITYAWTFQGATPSTATVADPAPVAFNTAGTFTVTFTVRDSVGATASATRTVTVTAPQPPVAGADSYAAAAGRTLTVLPPGVLGNDASRPAGRPLTARLVSNVNSANLLTFNSDGSFIYSPASGFSGTDRFTYQALDGSLASATATVTITVTAPLPISRAEWDDRELEVRGSGAAPRGTVILYNASGGPEIARTTASSTGTWRFDVRRLTAPPCTVKVVAGNREGTRAVSDAPSNCVR